MANKENIKQINFDPMRDLGEIDYMNEEIAFYTDIRELPIENGPLRANILIVIACVNGKMQVELNTISHTIHKNEVLICRPNALLSNLMLSPDFDGMALCMTQKGILEQFSENELWKKAFHFEENPIIFVSAESLHMLNLYGKILKNKIKKENSFYQKEIITSIIRIAMYELMANVDDGKSDSYSYGLKNQREVLFKRFIDMLVGTQTKPRNISWYAERLYISPKYLSTVCKQVSGKTAFSWINEYVQLDIRHWLKNSNKTIKEIADLLNFPNISFFGKYCRTHFGVSPTVLRQQLRE